MKKRSFSLLLALILLLSLLPGTAQAADLPAAYVLAGEQAQSGALDRDPLTKREIYDLLNAAPLDGNYFYYKPDGAFDEAPSVTEPYSPGKVSSAALQKTLNRLNALRALAGLPAVELDAALCENAQYGALAMAYLGTITHYPAQGYTADEFAKLPSDIRTKAAEAASSSNLSAGMNLTWAVDGLMDDSDYSNIDRLGHRRWQLNPSMGKVGFGYAVSDTSYSQYVVEKVFDTSRKGQVDYNFVAWPASGNFPNNLEAFNGDSAWSVSLNPNKYSTNNLKSVSVTITGGGQTWTLSSSSGDGYFNVDTGGYGVSNCIIFCPYYHEKYEGDYNVTISGLKDRSGKDAVLSYTVSFFDASVAPADEPAPEPTPEPTPEPIPTPAQSESAMPTNDRLTVNGVLQSPTVYKITGANFFKIRDLAAVLNGTEKQFDVGYDNALKSVTVTTGKGYEKLSTDLAGAATGGNQTADPSNDTIYIDGQKIDVTVYKIGGSNYFKLRDLGKALGFYVGWTAEDGVFIDTGKPYSD